MKSSLRRYLPIIEAICEEQDIDFEDGVEMMEVLFKDVSLLMSDDTMPAIYLKNFGTFRPTIKRINWRLRIAFFYYKRGSFSRERLVAMIRKLWPVKQRLIREKYQNAITWKDWRNIDRDSSKWDPEFMKTIGRSK